MSANDRQVGGNHYRTEANGVQHWDLAAARNYDYFQGQVTKYVDRWKEKNGIIDLEKAKHFLEKYIEVMKAIEDSDSPTKPSWARTSPKVEFAKVSQTAYGAATFQGQPRNDSMKNPRGFDPSKDCLNYDY